MKVTLLIALISALVAGYYSTQHHIHRIQSIFPTKTPPPKNTSALNVGIIGASDISKFAVIWPASRNPFINVHSIAARDVDKASRFATKHNIPIIHSTYEDLIHDDEVDVVYISIISELHYKYAKIALQQNKHVLLEKPATLANPNEAQELALLAKQKKLVLLEGFHWRFHPAAQRVHQIISSGEIGDLIEIQMVSNMYDPKANQPMEEERKRVKLLDRWCYLVDEMFFYIKAGGSIRNKQNQMNMNSLVDNMEIHQVNLSPNRITANMTAISQTFIHESDTSSENTLLGNIQISFDAYKDKLELPQWFIRIIGTKGSVQYNNVIFPFAFHSIDVDILDKSSQSSKSSRIETVYYSKEEDKLHLTTTFDHQLDYFVQLVKSNLKDEEIGHDTDLVEQMIVNAKMAERIIKSSGQDLISSW